MPSLPDFIRDATREDQEQLDAALLRGEQLFWALRPVPTAWTSHTRFVPFFCTIWLGFIAFWTYGALGFPTTMQELEKALGENLAMPLFSIPFWLAGFFLASLPWQQKRRMQRTIYAVTDRRALVIEKKFFSWNTRAFALTPELILSRKVRKGNCGDLIFEEEATDDSRGHVEHGFINVPDVTLTEAKLDEAIRARQVATSHNEPTATHGLTD